MINHAQIQKRKDSSNHRAPKMGQHQGTSSRGADLLATQQLLAHPDTISAQDIQALQRTVGNQATTHFIQAKLHVGPVGDRYEREADRVAQQVMAMPGTRSRTQVQRQEEEEELQAKPLAATISPLVQRQEEEEELQMKSRVNGGFTVDTGTKSRLKSLRGSGEPLSKELRSFMEPRFGANFDSVRVHTGSEATQISREINAKAFTNGQDIYFGNGTFRPKTDDGKRLLAHELTHVVQQTGAVQRAPQAPAYVDEDFRQKIANRRQKMGYEDNETGLPEAAQQAYEATHRPLAAYQGEHLEEKKEAAARLALILHPRVPPLPPRPEPRTPPPLPPRPARWQAAQTPGQSARGTFLAQERQAQPGWQAGHTPDRGAPRGNFLGARQTAPTVKKNIVIAKAHTRLIKQTLEGTPAQQVKAVEKSKKHKLYNRFDLVEIAESDSAHVKNDAGEVVWYQIKGSSNEYIRASSVLSSAPTEPEKTGPGAGEGGAVWSGMDLVESAVSTTDDRLFDRLRHLTAQQETRNFTSQQETELTRVTYAEGAVWSAVGVLGMATSLKSLVSDESSRWDRVEAAFKALSSGEAVLGGTTQIASAISASKLGEESTTTKATAGISTFALSFQEFFSSLASLVQMAKNGVDLIRKVYAKFKSGKSQPGNTELVKAGSGVLLNALAALKGAAKGARAFNEGLGNNVTSAFSAGATTVAVGIDIAISAIKTIMQGYYLAVSAYQWWKMSKRERELKAELATQGYSEKQIKDVKGIRVRREAMLADLDRLIAQNEKKIENKDLQAQKLISGAKTSQQLAKRKTKVDKIDEDIESLRQQNKEYKKQKTEIEQEAKEQETAAVSGPAGQIPQSGESKSMNLAEVDLVGELRYINRKRIVRQSIHISSNLVQIAGSIATLVSGPGAPAALALKGSAAGIDLSLPFFRAIKQYGRKIAAKNRAKGTSGISNKIFNADKSTAAKLQMRKRQAVQILRMVAQLNDLMPTARNPVEYTKQVETLKAQAKRVEEYIIATGCEPETLYRANGKPDEQITILVKELAKREFD